MRVWAKYEISWYEADDADGYGPWITAREAYANLAYKLIKRRHGAATAHVQRHKPLTLRLIRYLQFLDRREFLMQHRLSQETDQLNAKLLLGLTGGNSGMYEEAASATVELFGTEKVQYDVKAWADLEPNTRAKFYIQLMQTIADRKLSKEAFEPIAEWLVARLREQTLLALRGK